VFTESGVLFDVIIFVLLAVQRQLYRHREFELVRLYIMREWKNAKTYALERYKGSLLAFLILI